MDTMPIPYSPVPERHWYALVVQPRHEKAVEEYLRKRGLEALCPTYRAARRWSDRTKVIDFPLFEGYVFCCFSYAQRILALSTTGVRSIVSFGPAPEPIPEVEIAALQSIGRSGLPARPWPYLRAGQRVQVVKGCLAGLEGIMAREKDRFRVVVSVEMLMRSVAVEVERDSIAPVKCGAIVGDWVGDEWRYGNRETGSF
ncbi:MAG: transcription termination/antitermination protein NusG [Bryobacteraceae bacterium]